MRQDRDAAPKLARVAPQPSGPDHGTAWRAAQGLGVVTGDDQVARTRSIHDWLLAKGLIDQTEHDAAEQYRTDFELSAGATDGAKAGGSTAPWDRRPGLAQVNAASRIRRADEVLGADVVMFVEAVVHGVSLMTLAVRHGGSKGGTGSRGSRAGKRIAQRMRNSLETLVRHYFGVKRGEAA